MLSWLAALIVWLTCSVALAQPSVRDLAVEIQANRVRFDTLNGNGSSSGSAIVGELVNLTSGSLRIEVHLGQPLFLENQGAGQNMVVSAIYLDGGRYQREGSRAFVPIKPRSKVRVTLIAYCADFDKTNPRSDESFSVGPLPEKLRAVIQRIQAHARANPNEDITAGAQAAVWLAQDVSMRTIRTRFAVSQAEEQLARSFLR